MKILTLHVDYINFKPLKKALKGISSLTEKQKKGEKVKESLVVLTAVEKGDSVEESVKELVKSIKDVAKQVKAKDIVLYPYAHLSNDLASPEVAAKVLDKTAKSLKGFKVTKAPFGYYKEFELKVKGHPLSELSREIRSEGKGKKAGEEKFDHKNLLRRLGKSVLDRSKLKAHDHRILGQEMDLFSFNDVAPGMIFWHNNGLIIRDELINFWKEVHKKEGYQEISTPQILDKKLWQISGHWEKYKENIFLTDYEKRMFAVKPMNCPGGILIYKSKTKSYKDLPLRVGELGIVHRQELSGVLGGLFRVIQFIQDDAHIYCTEKQMLEELIKIIDLSLFFYAKTGLKVDHIELSIRPKKRIGTDEMWDKSEAALEKALKKRKIKFKTMKGEGAFYGPKIDFHVKDSLGRTWQLGTIQLDFAMPDRFNLEYIDKDNKRKRPVMIHRAIYGSMERFIGILLEHYNGRLPTWLAPVQVRVLSFTNKNEKYAKKVVKQLEKVPGLRIDFDLRSMTISSKVKDAELMRIPYIGVVADKEEKSGSVALRIRGDKKIKTIKVSEFAKSLNKEISEKK